MAWNDFETAAQPGKARLTCMFLERTTGFEPATLTLAKWGTVLVPKSLRR